MILDLNRPIARYLYSLIDSGLNDNFSGISHRADRDLAIGEPLSAEYPNIVPSEFLILLTHIPFSRMLS